MLGWDLWDGLQYAVLCISLVVTGLAGRRGSAIYKLFFKKNQPPSDRVLKLLRTISLIGVLVVGICAIASRIIYVIQNR